MFYLKTLLRHAAKITDGFTGTAETNHIFAAVGEVGTAAALFFSPR